MSASGYSPTADSIGWGLCFMQRNCLVASITYTVGSWQYAVPPRVCRAPRRRKASTRTRGLISQSSNICIGGQVADLYLLRQQVEQAARQPGERFEAL